MSKSAEPRDARVARPWAQPEKLPLLRQISPALCFTTVSSPVGRLLLTGLDERLHGLWMLGEKHAPPHSPDWEETSAPFAEVIRQLEEYFAGQRREFNLSLGAKGTDFQAKVWAGLMTIPYGCTLSYSGLASRIGHPAAVRAVGLANGRNPVSIIVPCHRVIGQNGRLTGYGGGLEAKRWLLEHEARHSDSWNEPE